MVFPEPDSCPRFLLYALSSGLLTGIYFSRFHAPNANLYCPDGLTMQVAILQPRSLGSSDTRSVLRIQLLQRYFQRRVHLPICILELKGEASIHNILGFCVAAMANQLTSRVLCFRSIHQHIPRVRWCCGFLSEQCGNQDDQDVRDHSSEVPGNGNLWT